MKKKEQDNSKVLILISIIEDYIMKNKIKVMEAINNREVILAHSK